MFIPMSDSKRARRFRERLKAAKVRLVYDADSANNSTSGVNPANTSTAAVPILILTDITSEDTNHTSVEAATTRLENETDPASTATASLPIPTPRAAAINATRPCGNSILKKHTVGHICLVDVKSKIVRCLFSVPKPSILRRRLKMLRYVFVNRSSHIVNLTKVLPISQPDLETPIVLCGDFNNE